MPKEKIKDRKAAELFFVDYFLDAASIAEKLNVEPATVGRWRKLGNWDKKREDTINDPSKMRRLLAKELLLVAQGKESNINADALAKLHKVYEGFSDRINPGIVHSVMKLYDEYLAKENPELALENLPFNKKFLIHIINQNG